MATPRRSNNTSLSSSIDERRQVQARIRALQQRTSRNSYQTLKRKITAYEYKLNIVLSFFLTLDALNEELSRSSSVAKTAVHDVERAYMRITNEYREQRDQLLQNLYHVNKNIKESTNELDGIRKSLSTAQSFHLPLISPRYSTDYETHEMNAMVDDIERVLNKISQQLKQFHFIPSHGHAMGKILGTIRVKNTNSKETGLTSPESYMDQYYSTDILCVYKLYTVDLDISAKWVISTIEQRIFLCDIEGEVRIFSYSRHFRRQPLLRERFHLSNIRLISSFTATQDYLIAFEIDTQILTLHTHHGALILRLFFPYDPLMIVRCDYHKKNQIWTCSRTKRQCYQFNINHKIKQVNLLDQLDFTKPISNILIDPIGISCDEQERVAVHDVNMTTTDRLLLFSNNQNTIIPLDFVKYFDKLLSSRIERVLLVPKQSNLIVIIYVPQSSTTNVHEIVIVDISLQPAQIVHCLSEPNGIQSIDVTSNGELVYTVTTPTNKRTPPKMHIYKFKHTVYSQGICGNLQILPTKRSCTPFLHIHPYQTEIFTILQGHFSYQYGDEIYSCDIHTCPSPIIIHPNIPHTFWMNDNKEDLILIVRIEPTYKDRGLSAKSFENIVGVVRDKYMTIWQAFVFVDNIETYPIFLPLPFVKIIIKIDSLIEQLLGYQTEYEEYTTK
ncbi:unnamed protein product [Rotaria sp. Silwood1]|nr:unnamed protein product [Rotaria sp. Silwood1]